MALPIHSLPDPIYEAINSVVLELKHDLRHVASITDRVLLVNIEMSDTFKTDSRSHFINTLSSLVYKNLHFPLCSECAAPRAEISGGKFIVKKGALPKEKLNVLLKSYDSKYYAKVALLYTGTRVILAFYLYDSVSDRPAWQKKYQSRLLFLSKTGFTVSFGLHSIITSDPRAYPLEFSLLLGERIYGIGKVGLSVLVTQNSTVIPSIYTMGIDFLLNLNELFRYNIYWLSFSLTTRVNLSLFPLLPRQVLTSFGAQFDVGAYTFLRVEALRSFSLTEGQTRTFPWSLVVGFGSHLW